jgi:hypothetical protein
MAVVAVSRPPAGINRELGQVSEPLSDQGGVNSGGSTARQGAKRIEICRSCSMGDQVRIEELVMSDLIIGIVVDVLSHISVQHCDVGGVEWTATSTRDFGVLDATQFVVLDPKVGLEYF